MNTCSHVGNTELLTGDITYAMELTASGFDVTRDDYRVYLKRGSVKKEIDRENISVEEGVIYLCLTKELLAEMGVGDVYIIVHADVPDSRYSFRDGIRTEPYKQYLCTLSME